MPSEQSDSPLLIGICQEPGTEQPWFELDRPTTVCVVGGCRCTPILYMRRNAVVGPEAGL